VAVFELPGDRREPLQQNQQRDDDRRDEQRHRISWQYLGRTC
jgi:hypothetical protein